MMHLPEEIHKKQEDFNYHTTVPSLPSSDLPKSQKIEESYSENINLDLLIIKAESIEQVKWENLKVTIPRIKIVSNDFIP